MKKSRLSKEQTVTIIDRLIGTQTKDFPVADLGRLRVVTEKTLFGTAAHVTHEGSIISPTFDGRTAWQTALAWAEGYATEKGWKLSNTYLPNW